MKFLADEGVERVVVAELRRGGHDVRYVAEESPGLDDAAVLALADADGRVLVTNDKDFGRLVFLGGLVATGIVLFRVGTERAAVKAARIADLLRADPPLLEGYFTVIGARSVRRRPLRSR